MRSEPETNHGLFESLNVKLILKLLRETNKLNNNIRRTVDKSIK